MKLYDYSFILLKIQMMNLTSIVFAKQTMDFLRKSGRVALKNTIKNRGI